MNAYVATEGQTSAATDGLILGIVNMIKENSVCIALSLSPAGDAMDLAALVSGIDPCTGDKLGVSDRMFSALGIAIGSGAFWRGVAKTRKLSSQAKLASKMTFDAIEKGKKLGLKESDLLDMVKRYNDAFPCT